MSDDYTLAAGQSETFSDKATHTYETATIAGDLAIGMDYAYSGADFGTLSVAAAGLWSMNRYKAAVKDGRAPEEDWDELEKSIVANIADDVQIGIAGQDVEMVIIKKF